MPSCTLTSGSTVITLPNDIEWSDEYGGYSSVGMTFEVSSNGAGLIELGTAEVARPITLKSGNRNGAVSAVLNKATCNAIDALANTASITPMTLLLYDGRSFPVIFDWRNGGPFAADRWTNWVAPVADSDIYTVTIKLMVVTSG